MKKISNDLVSVIIPVFKNVNLLRDSLLSVEKQTYPFIEIIIVNDGSKFHQEINKICEQFKKKIKIFHSKINQGVSTALNKGIIESKGKYINWLSHDDLFKPTKIEEQIKSLRGSDMKISATNFLIWDSDKNVTKRSRLTKEDFVNLDKKILLKDIYNFCTLLIPKKLFNNNLFDENLRYTQDYQMLFKLSKKAKFIFLNKDLFISRKHSQQGIYIYKKKWILEKNYFYTKNMKFYINLITAEKFLINIFFFLFFLHKKKLNYFSIDLDNNLYKLNKKKVIIVNKLAKIAVKILYNLKIL
jgi:glycosyltransferase involved in cell wall biosynthesis